MARGRTIGSMGQAFGPMGQVDHGFFAGQPVMVRMQGVPTMPGYRDRPGKWNMEGWRQRLAAWWKRAGLKPVIDEA
ncbi:MAG TPA: hypothetical protein VII92_11490 [Anaerolineae bacterium]